MKGLFVVCALGMASLATAVQPATSTFQWEMSYVTAAPDGFSRPVIGVNGKWPPPAITVSKGDQVVINVVNNLDDGEFVTLHTHGLFQNGTNYMDGVDQLTQWYTSHPLILICVAEFRPAIRLLTVSTSGSKPGHTGSILISKDSILMAFERPSLSATQILLTNTTMNRSSKYLTG
jgi:hypothetical protein